MRSEVQDAASGGEESEKSNQEVSDEIADSDLTCVAVSKDGLQQVARQIALAMEKRQRV